MNIGASTTTTNPSYTMSTIHNNNTSSGYNSNYMNAKTRCDQLIQEYWKKGDFIPLQDAGNTINAALRADEENADLYRKIVLGNNNTSTSSSGINNVTSSHLYFPYQPFRKDSMNNNNNINNNSHNNNINMQSGYTSPYNSISTPSTNQHYDSVKASSPPPPPEQLIQHMKSVPLPSMIKEQLSKVRMHTTMGLLSDIHMAYVSVDDKLYLWSYQSEISNSSTASYENNTTTTTTTALSSIISFVVPSGQCVVSVGLVKPKRGVFKSNVEWCLVIATPDEVLLCALVRAIAVTNPNGNSSQLVSPTASSSQYSGDGGGVKSSITSSCLQLVPTSFVLSTDNVRVLTIAGSDTGRIFLGGDDGCLYEMTYQLGSSDETAYDNEPGGKISHLLEQFYDHDTIVPDVIVEDEPSELVTLGKRAWSTLKATATILGDSTSDQRPRKCAKINRTFDTPSIVKAIVPDFVVRGTSYVFGGPTSASGGKIIQIEIDEHRGCIYTLSTLGWICSFDLHNNGAKSVLLTAVIDTPRTARLYLEAVSRGQGFPPSSNASQTIGAIVFPGGGLAAQAGVGGMDGARAILKHADFSRQANGATHANGGGILKPTSIHIIAPTESSRLTVLAVTESGLRFYLSSLTPHVISNGADAVMAGRYGSRVIRNPLSPSNRITLCHIRAPPPTDINQIRDRDFSADSCEVVGGIAPRVSRSKIPLLHSSFYKQGVFVIAMDETEHSTSVINPSRQFVGDVILAMCPSTIARKLESPVPSTTPDKSQMNEKPKSVYANVGGITESLSFPMSTTSPDNGSMHLLPGGIVWDIAEVSTNPRSVLDLLYNSATPSDNELSIGLPPPYYPPFKTKSQDSFVPSVNGNDRRSSNGQSNLSSNAIVSVDSPLSKTAIKIIGNVVTNLLLSRPIRSGILSVHAHNLGINGDYDDQPSYRISKRITSKGFSETAGEGSKGSETQISTQLKQPVYSRSARLRPWLLRPSTVPLSHVSTHAYSGSHDIVALNAGGVHFFSRQGVLSNLAATLIGATGNIADDTLITNFFNAYGYKEGCCMCIALAIGCGNASGSVSEVLKSRAISAALSRAFVPKLIIRPDPTSGPILSGVVPKDPLIPEGYEFKGSALYEGLVSLFSRLVRPMWHKPAVVVTEGRMVKLRWSSKVIQSPAKVETIFDDEVLQEVGTVLRNLLTVMKSVFFRAVKTVPGLSLQNGNNMDIDDNDDNILTKSIQYNVNSRNATSGLALQLSHTEAEYIARLLEEKNIHSLYRVLARLVQLLNLMSLLRRAHSMMEFKEVDWGLLHGLTISQLVQCPEGQDRLENLLNSLVTTSASKYPNASISSAQADQLANLFADQCYLFFSPASRYAYLGLRSANEALSLPIFSPSRNDLAIQAAKYLRQAATHWHSAPLVTGRMIHAKGNESYNEIARRAIQSGSPLARAVEVLMDLEDVVNVVEICLITASNFAGRGASVELLTNGAYEGNYELGWEHNLYHKRRDELLNDNETSLGSPTMKSTSTSIVAFGTEVTGKAAIDSCYSLIFYHLSSLLSSRNAALADSMVSTCSAANDVTFLNAFFSYLLDNDHADTLLRIDSSALHEWLKEKDDPDLLWRYYIIQRRFIEAGQVAFQKAKITATLPLNDRIEWLSRALNAFKSAINNHHGNIAMEDLADAHQRVTEVDEALQVAQLQLRILNAIDLTNAKNTSIDLYNRLHNELISVSELYNDYAAAFSMFDECLLIIHVCRHENTQTIQTLWTNVLCEEILPCATYIESVYRFLETFVADVGLSDMIKFRRENEEDRTFRLLEDGEWEKSLVRRIVNLGKNLYGKGASYVFPVEFILYNLEQLKQAILRSVSPGWSLLTIADAGVPFLVTLDAYESVTLRNDRVILGGIDADKHIEKVSAVLELLEYWVELAKSCSKNVQGPKNDPYQQISTAIASGQLMQKIDDIKQKIEMVPQGSRSLLGRLQSIEQNMRRFM